MASTFESLGLDPRLVRAAAKRGYTHPTAIQALAVPLALAGRDVLARARTGSGKTAAYLLPMLHRLLLEGPTSGGAAGPRALILVPTRELCAQVTAEAAALSAPCGGSIRCGSLPAVGAPAAALRAAAMAKPDVLVSTPGRLATVVRDGLLPSLSGVRMCVLDEADLLLSYGYEADLGAVAARLPPGVQVMLVSATLGEDVDRLTALLLRDPVIAAPPDDPTEGEAHAPGAMSLTGPGAGLSSRVTHYVLRVASARDRLLHIAAGLRLGVFAKKALVFVGGVDTGVRLKLFLEHFGVKAAVLNAELPANSRAHILNEFNRGLFDYLIATDAGEAGGEEVGDPGGTLNDETHTGMAPPTDAVVKPGGKRGRGRAVVAAADVSPDAGEFTEGTVADGRRVRTKRAPPGGSEFGAVRGLDFKGVRTVINYDVPSSAEAYVHRVGRTGRAGAAGAAVTLVAPEHERALAALITQLNGGGAATRPPGDGDDGIDVETDGTTEAAAAVGPSPSTAGFTLAPFTGLPPAQVEALRYRAEDVTRAVSRPAVAAARARELRSELLNSERLAAHFEDHPRDLQVLRHDAPLAKAPQPAHLKHIPPYLRAAGVIPATPGDAPTSGRGGPRRGGGGKAGARKDPLRTLRFAPEDKADARATMKSELRALEDSMGLKRSRVKRAAGGPTGPPAGRRVQNSRRGERKRSR